MESWPTHGQVFLPLMLLTVIGCSVLGNTVGYGVGRRFGDRVLNGRLLRRHRGAIGAARERALRLGGRAIVLGRFGAPLRAFTPVIAGTAGIAYREFQWCNVIGGVVWAGGFTVIGYLAGSSYQAVADYVELFG